MEKYELKCFTAYCCLFPATVRGINSYFFFFQLAITIENMHVEANFKLHCWSTNDLKNKYCT